MECGWCATQAAHSTAGGSAPLHPVPSRPDVMAKYLRYAVPTQAAPIQVGDWTARHQTSLPDQTIIGLLPDQTTHLLALLRLPPDCHGHLEGRGRACTHIHTHTDVSNSDAVRAAFNLFFTHTRLHTDAHTFPRAFHSLVPIHLGRSVEARGTRPHASARHHVRPEQ